MNALQIMSMQSFKRALLALLPILLSACSTLVPIPAATTGDATQITAAEAQSAWARVLKTYVNERGEVDFTALSGDRKDLDRYVSFVATTPAKNFTEGAPRLAHYINSYNALSMYNVIDLGIPKTNASLASRYTFFIARKFTVGGETMSLYDYENKVIRALGEPRIHWALNCSAVSCPVLPREPFVAETLDAQLESEARKFFADLRNARADANTREVWLTEIFSLFPEDFVPKHAPSFTHYANRYRDTPLPTDFRIRITPYDWTIANSRRER